MEKIYCINCKYLNLTTQNIGYKCSYPENVKQNFNDNWLKIESVYKYKKPPFEINKHNNCRWYEVPIRILNV